LIGPHYIQIEIGFDLKELKGVVQHRAVLARVHYRGLEISRPAAKFMNDQG